MVKPVGNNTSRFDQFANKVSPVGAVACALGILGIGLGLHFDIPDLATAGYVVTAVGGVVALPGAIKAGQWAINAFFGNKEEDKPTPTVVAAEPPAQTAPSPVVTAAEPPVTATETTSSALANTTPKTDPDADITPPSGAYRYDVLK